MSKLRKTAIFLVAMMAAVVIGGCGASFNASDYVEALLDNSYKNDSAAFVEQKIGTKEEAEELYNQGIDAEIQSMVSGIDISDELTAEYEELFKEMFKSVKYTVGEATKNGDDYVVEVKYQKMKVFGPAMESYTAAATAYVEELTQKAANGEETLSDAEMMEEVYGMLKDAVKESLANVTYEDEASATVRVELNDNVYTPNQTDITNLEECLFDIDAVLGE